MGERKNPEMHNPCGYKAINIQQRFRRCYACCRIENINSLTGHCHRIERTRILGCQIHLERNASQFSRQPLSYFFFIISRADKTSATMNLIDGYFRGKGHLPLYFAGMKLFPFISELALFSVFERKPTLYFIK